jgi:phosphoribosylformimino-5-aminoimidazole carboxamide ribotide isomerase
MSFEIIPAIDVLGGRVVRLAQGDYARETRFAEDPFALACAWAAQGARWLHLVDLGAARTGGYSLQPLLLRLCADSGLQVQTGGGIRDEAQVEALLACGATRVVLGTVAGREPERVAGWLRRFGAERLVLALDARTDGRGGWRVQSEGWTGANGAALGDLLQFYALEGARHVLCTDVSRDGMLGGFNLALYRDIAGRFPGLRLQASGGVRDLADLRGARASGAGGAILGRALLEGRLGLAEALAC